MTAPTQLEVLNARVVILLDQKSKSEIGYTNQLNALQAQIAKLTV